MSRRGFDGQIYRGSEPEPVEIAGVRCVRETAKALLVEVDGEEIWLPRSQLRLGTTVHARGDSGVVVLPRWLAVTKGLAEEADSRSYLAPRPGDPDFDDDAEDFGDTASLANLRWDRED